MPRKLPPNRPKPKAADARGDRARQFLINLMTEKDLNDSEFAREVGCAQSEVQRVRTGVRAMPKGLAKRIGAHFHLDWELVYSGRPLVPNVPGYVEHLHVLDRLSEDDRRAVYRHAIGLEITGKRR